MNSSWSTRRPRTAVGLYPSRLPVPRPVLFFWTEFLAGSRVASAIGSGITLPRPCSSGRSTVYPRVCGRTRLSLLLVPAPLGLSPRVRENRNDSRAGCQGARSIPACAGEPAAVSSCACTSSVYPRVCGRTWLGAPPTLAHVGLSPRVRENRTAAPERCSRERSIPACAGEPRGPAPQRGSSAVYPRVCGRTVLRRCRLPAARGLSPRVRENR